MASLTCNTHGYFMSLSLLLLLLVYFTTPVQIPQQKKAASGSDRSFCGMKGKMRSSRAVNQSRMQSVLTNGIPRLSLRQTWATPPTNRLSTPWNSVLSDCETKTKRYLPTTDLPYSDTLLIPCQSRKVSPFGVQATKNSDTTMAAACMFFCFIGSHFCVSRCSCHPPHAGKGGKNRRRGKGDGEESKRELEFKEDGTLISNGR
jgi:hypothetical protein